LLFYACLLDEQKTKNPFFPVFEIIPEKCGTVKLTAPIICDKLTWLKKIAKEG